MLSAKKVLSLILTVIMLGLLFTGCTPSKPADVKGEVPALIWYLPGDKQSALQNVLNKVNEITEKKIGAKLDIQFVDTGSYAKRMTMLVASETDFDMCFTSDWLGDFVKNSKKGAFAPIGELIDKNAPLLKSELPDYIWNASTVDKEIYAVPHLQVLFSQLSIAVFKDFADKYSLDPSSVKELTDLEPFFEKVKNGEKTVYPFRTLNAVDAYTSPVYELIQPGSMGMVIRKDGNGSEVLCLTETEEYKKGINTVHSFYKKGYIRPDVSTADGNDENDFMAGKYASYPLVWKPGVEAEEKSRLGREVIVIPIEEPYLKANAGMTGLTAINRTSKNKEKAIKFIELVNTDKELFNLLCFGIENIHYTKDADGKVIINKEGGYAPNAAWKFGNQFNAYYLQGQEDGTWEKTMEINDKAQRSPIAGFIPNIDPVKNESGQISSVNQEFKVIRSGGGDPEELYQKFVDKLKVAGLLKVRDEFQKQLGEWNAGK